MAEKETIVCEYCGLKVHKEYRRTDHNGYCPMQYPLEVAGCRDIALDDWQAGFDAKELPQAGDYQTPVWELGYLMGHLKSS